ncbi:hypothetical protein, partial [Paenibacillus sp. VTT E-133291]|uniref:hypothetical protein n=1 Tax=Paenibacillus sp. VTT E-133291 TaxID=1986223 RepID=UPI001C52B2AB
RSQISGDFFNGLPLALRFFSVGDLVMMSIELRKCLCYEQAKGHLYKFNDGKQQGVNANAKR